MKLNSYIVVLVIACAFLGNAEEKLGLYDETDDVVILTDSNFPSKVYNADRAWIVEFYNTWCGHCAKFAPEWKKFATELKGWQPVISIGAVDCAEKSNTGICRQYGISSFPNFRLFYPFSVASDSGVSWSNQDKEKMLKKMIDVVSDKTAFIPPESWPTLQPLSNVEHIWDHVQDKHLHIALIFEEEDSYLGRQVILDTFQSPHLLVRRLLRKSVTKYGITEFPSMYLISRDGIFTRIGQNSPTREGFVKALLELVPDKSANSDRLVYQSHERKTLQKDFHVVPKTQIAVYMKDLESALHYSFRQEIAMHREIEGDRLAALKQFLQVLVKYFPGRHVVNDLLAKISNWLSDVTQLTGDVWLSTIDNLQTLEAYLPDHIEWLGCKGSEPRYRGYPCGMWTLFHTLSVNAYNTARSGPRDTTPDVLTAIKNYMKNFFGCQTCVENFMRAASQLTTTDLEPHNAIMWLWRGHNRANAHLHGDPTEDPEHLKVQFPPKELCPKCYNGENFDEASVFQFLLKFYGEKYIIKYKTEVDEDYTDIHENENQENGNQPKALDWWELHQRKQGLERIQALRLQKNKNKRNKWTANKNLALMDSDDVKYEYKRKGGVIFGWGFSNFDMGMCITFYVMCTLIIVLLYYHFIVRRKYRPFKIFSM